MAKFSITGVESGASDSGALVGASPYDTSNDLLVRHRSAANGVENNNPNGHMLAGNYWEDASRQWFEDIFGCEITHPEIGYPDEVCNMVASLDGLFAAPCTLVDWQGVEHLIPDGAVWECKLPVYPSEGGPARPERVWQVQAQMMCSGADIAVIAELPRSMPEWQIAVIARDDDMIKQLRESVEEFWMHMDKGTQYPPATVEEASRMIGHNGGKVMIDLSDGPSDGITDEEIEILAAAADRYDAASGAIKVSDSIKKTAQLEMQTILGGREGVVIDGTRIKWGEVNYKAKPETIVPAKEASVGRRFSVKIAS
jgi:hypothetical protein